MNTKLLGLITGAVLLGGVGGAAAKNLRQPDYYWYGAAQTDSIRILLNANLGSRLKLEKRPKGSDHIWVGVLSAEGAKLAETFEVEESWPCPPRCD